jgi:predicted ATPase
MTAAAQRYGARVDPISHGDAILAVFGVPALEDHAVRACLAALSIQDAVRRWSDAQRLEGGPVFQVRIGLNSGEIVATERQTDGQDGEATVLAKRVEGLATPGKILLTKSTWLLAKGFIRAVPLGPTHIRGKQEAIELFELEGIQARTRFNARQNQGLTPFVGRDAELDLLARALRRAETAEGQVVVLTGGPGVGKSRLVHHFLNLGAARDATVLETSAEPYDRQSGYSPIANLLRTELDVLPSDDAATIHAKVAARLRSRPELLEAAAALLDLPVSREPSGWHDLDPTQRRRRISDAVCELIVLAPRTSVLILLIEDLQWLDADARALVDTLVEQIRDRRVLLLLTSREMEQAEGRHSQLVSLDALEPLRTQELLRHLVGDAPETDRLAEMVFRRGDDRPTPLFIEETVSSLVEQGVLQGESGRYHLSGNLDSIERGIPHKVEEVLAVRIDRLPREHKQVLESAAVIGMEAPLELLAEVIKPDVDGSDAPGSDIGPLLRIFADLESAGLMHESLISGRSEFRFKHMLTREAAAARIPADHRRQLHARTVNGIEALYGHRREEWIDRLADHAYQARLSDKAVEYLSESCRRAIQRSANRHAVGTFEKSLQALNDVPHDDRRIQKEIDLRLLVVNALLPLGEQHRIGKLLDDAKELSETAHDSVRLAKVEVLRTLLLWEAGKHEDALASGEAALRLADENRLDHVALAARVHMGIVHHALGQFRKTLELHLRVLQQLIAGNLEKQRFSWAAYPSAITRAFCSDACIALGEFRHAESLIRDGQTLTEELGHPYSWAMIETVRGRYQLAHNQPHVALEIFERAAQRCRDDEVYTMVPAVVAGLGTALARLGRADEALRVVNDALNRKTYERAGNPALYYLLMARGEAEGSAGRVADGIATIRRAEELAASNHERAHLAQARYLLAGLLGRQNPGEAAAVYRAALAGARQCEMRPLEAACADALQAS